MSGGFFSYKQYELSRIIDDIEQEIRDNNAEPRPKDFFEPRNLKKETIDEFKKGIEHLKKALIYVQRIDWLLSGDDGEDTFHERLKEDLSKNK